MSTLDLFSPPRRFPLARGLGAGLVIFVAAFALLGPLLIPGDPLAQSLLKALSGPEAAAPLGPIFS